MSGLEQIQNSCAFIKSTRTTCSIVSSAQSLIADPRLMGQIFQVSYHKTHAASSNPDISAKRDPLTFKLNFIHLEFLLCLLQENEATLLRTVHASSGTRSSLPISKTCLKLSRTRKMAKLGKLTLDGASGRHLQIASRRYNTQ